MRRLIAARLEDVKFAAEHISTFNGLLNQLQDVGLQIFDDKMKAIFLLTTFSRKCACVRYSSGTTWGPGLGRVQGLGGRKHRGVEDSQALKFATSQKIAWRGRKISQVESLEGSKAPTSWKKWDQ